jgi:hypothetical protein
VSRRVAGLALGALLLLPVSAPASDARLGVDPRQDLAELERSGRVTVSVERVDGVYTMDASAVVHAGLAPLLATSLDYDRYTRIGMPHLQAMRVVAAGPDNEPRYAWSAMTGFGQSSRQYLAVRVHRGLGPSGAAAIDWTLVRRRPEWPYEEAPAFQRLDGAWYLEPLGERATYVRYAVTAVFDASVPEAVAPWLLKRQLGEGARGVVETLARAAGARP